MAPLKSFMLSGVFLTKFQSLMHGQPTKTNNWNAVVIQGFLLKEFIIKRALHLQNVRIWMLTLHSPLPLAILGMRSWNQGPHLHPTAMRNPSQLCLLQYPSQCTRCPKCCNNVMSAENYLIGWEHFLQLAQGQQTNIEILVGNAMQTAAQDCAQTRLTEMEVDVHLVS